MKAEDIRNHLSGEDPSTRAVLPEISKNLKNLLDQMRVEIKLNLGNKLDRFVWSQLFAFFACHLMENEVSISDFISKLFDGKYDEFKDFLMNQ